MKGILHIGIDVGSTTVKAVAYDNDLNTIYDRYTRHFSDIKGSVRELIDDLLSKVGDVDATIMVTGSGGLAVAKWLNVGFIQEVVACSRTVKKVIPETDVAIELGGEDAKITYFAGSIEQRMNGTCAGGTGAFIDQMAVLLKTDAAGLNELAKNHKMIYSIAARCGVFAKSDVQPLLNEGAPKEDIAASILQAVVNQTISGLACGRPIKGNVAFLGGPMYFLTELRKLFIKTLKLSEEQAIIPKDSMLFVAAGAAIESMDEKPINTALLKQRINEEHEKTGPEVKRLPRLFESEEQIQEFKDRHHLAAVKKQDITEYEGKCFLGIDAGSTTTKAVLISEDGNILYNYYSSNEGNPLEKCIKILKDIYSGMNPNAKIAYSAVTGYGEALMKAALRMDYGEVETVAHYKAAAFFKPDVDFILDIGGQDMKCMRIKDGAIEDVVLNEACSSGCGSFLEGFAKSLDMNIEDFANKALLAKNPVDLGSRCTVFMNSRVKQVQKEGAEVAEISAGLSYSVIKNALIKVIKIKDTSELGDNIVVQGGTFYNNAALRAFELIAGKEVVRPDIAGLMGAFGAALIALEQYRLKVMSMPENAKINTSLIPVSEIDDFKVKKKSMRCKGCENNCLLTINIFEDKTKFIAGNRCEIGLQTGEKVNSLPDLFRFKYDRIFSYKPLEDSKVRRGSVGIPRVLNFYENYPFWHIFFTELGYKVVLSPHSNRKVYEEGLESIPSESACYPAKIVHGHIMELINKGVDFIFYPCVPYEYKEHNKADNNYNCPIVTSYPENIKNNVDLIRQGKAKLMAPFLPMDQKKPLAERLFEEFKSAGISKKEIYHAVALAWAEKIKFRDEIRKMGESVLDRIQKGELKGVVLAGRPYHIDPEINHGISSIITQLGFAVLTEDAVSHLDYQYKSKRVLDQWMYHSRLYGAATVVGQTKGLELVQLNSFGCGLDAVTTDQVEEIMKAYGKFFTLIKIDEVNNTGAVKIRLRSLKAAIDERERLDMQRLTAATDENINDNEQSEGGLSPISNLVKKEYEGFKKVLFEKWMKKDYTILAPQMSPIHFDLIKHVFNHSGYNFVILPSVDHAAVEEGLKYVNNDACYPSILVTGQIMEAVKSGKYDTNKLAVMISQTGGGCRASNYIGFIRKALIDAGYEHIPVISLSASGMEKHPGFTLTLPFLRRAMIALVYGDLFNRLILRTRPYEKVKGTAEGVFEKWHTVLERNIQNNRRLEFKKNIKAIVKEFDEIETIDVVKPRVGVVGEILVKYHPTANNEIVSVLENEGAEVVVPDLLDFFLYSSYNANFNHEQLKRKRKLKIIGNIVIGFIERYRKPMKKELKKSRRFSPPSFITEKAKRAAEFISIGNQTGEGWFLTGEMAELIDEGIDNIVCVQPFACLPNHVVGKGVIQPLRNKYPNANIVAVDYDPGTSEVNQLNRIKLMLSVAFEKVKNKD